MLTRSCLDEHTKDTLINTENKQPMFVDVRQDSCCSCCTNR